MENDTYITGFNLMPFSAKSGYTSLTTSVFFFLYVFGVFINTSIITVINTVPNLLHMLLSGDNTVSFIQCFTQLYFFASVGGAEYILIFIMAYDRYVAICHPLHYHNILSKKHCTLLASATWIVGFLNSFVFTTSASHMSFCQSHVIHQFFCDATALIDISCAGREQFYIVIYLEFLILGFFPAMFNFTSYIKIIRVILQVKSKEGRKKAFSTCSSHLTMVIMYYMTCFCAFMMPISDYSNVLEQVFSALYSVVTPMINPLIYSLRNKDVKSAVLRLLGIYFNVQKRSS